MIPNQTSNGVFCLNNRIINILFVQLTNLNQCMLLIFNPGFNSKPSSMYEKQLNSYVKNKFNNSCKIFNCVKWVSLNV